MKSLSKRPHKPAGNVEFTFENQVIRRKVD